MPFNDRMSADRRSFLKAGALAGAALSGIRAPGAQPASDNLFDRPMRWAQLTLVEDDPPKFDLNFWLDYFRRIHADAACLSAGGCVAYYPTKIPLHHRSAWLGDRDPFGDLVAGCRKLNMVVIGRVDPHAVHQDVYDAHPKWIAVDEEGRKRRHWESPELWVTCGLGPYNFEYITGVIKEVVSLYGVDGVFTNRWRGQGMCYCEHCRRDFGAAYGMELPRGGKGQVAARKNYVLWRQDRIFKLWRLWDSEIQKVRAQARFIGNAGGGALSDLDMRTIGQLAPTLFADRQGRSGVVAPWSNGKNGKEFRSTMGRKPAVGIFSVGETAPHRWKDSVQHEAEIRVWVADGIANGLRPWFTKFSATLYDRRWLKTVEDIYNWHYGAQRYLRNERSLARVAMVFSQQTGAFYAGSQAHQKVEDPIEGVYQALVEARIPFEMVHDGVLDREHIGQFRLLILPNIAALSAAQCDQLRAYVKNGGSLLATLETSLYDERGTRRTDFGLADLFGVSYNGRLEGPMVNSYLRLEKDSATGRYHPILRGLEDAGRIINGVWRVDVRPTVNFASPPLTLIPPYPSLPMEMTYPRVPKTDIAGVYLRELGRSRVVYFPWDIDRTFWEVLSVDHGKLFRNAVEWAANEEPPVTVTGPGVLDVTVWRQADSMTVHLVNLTNPMMMRGAFREIIPLTGQSVTIRLPQGQKASKVQFLVGGQPPRVEHSPDRLKLTVPSIGVHEVIAVDLA